MGFDINCGIQRKYNWSDIKNSAQQIFNNYDFEINWAEDAFNLLMFETVVKSDNIIPHELTDIEQGDALIWLAALYNIWFDYLCVIELEESSSDHDVGLSGFCEYSHNSIMDLLYETDFSFENISKYLNNDIFIELNERLLSGDAPKQSFYDIENDTFDFSGDENAILYNSERENVPNSIPLNVLYKEIYLRMDYIKKHLRKLFINEVDTIEFFTCKRWVLNYSDYPEKVNKLNRKFNTLKNRYLKDGNEGIQKVLKYDYEFADIEELEQVWNDELESLEEDYFNEPNRQEYYEDEIYSWIYEW